MKSTQGKIREIDSFSQSLYKHIEMEFPDCCLDLDPSCRSVRPPLQQPPPLNILTPPRALKPLIGTAVAADLRSDARRGLNHDAGLFE